MPSRGRSAPSLRRTKRRSKSRKAKSLSLPKVPHALPMEATLAVPIISHNNAYNAISIRRVHPRSPRGTMYANARPRNFNYTVTRIGPNIVNRSTNIAHALPRESTVAVPVLTLENMYNAAALPRVNPRSPRGTMYANARLRGGKLSRKYSSK